MEIKYLTKGELISGEFSERCRVCSSEDIESFAVIDSHMLSNKKLHLLHCKICGSYFYGGGNPVEGYLSGLTPGGNWKHYVQYGAGIMAMLQPLYALGDAAKGDLLDIGCGFGFVPHYWETLKLGQAVGLEGAEYGKKGKELLNVTVYDSYYEECEELRGKQFDVIYSSEVLEHIAAPVEFLRQARGGLRKGGVLILTTPSSSVIDKKGIDCVTMAVLSPHFHYFISSEQGLSTMLEAAGFRNFRILDRGGGLTAWASNDELPPINPDKPDWEAYFSYLNILSKNQDPNISGGAIFRLGCDFYNIRRMDEALKSFERLERLAGEVYDLSFKYPEIRRYLSRRSPTERLDQDPAWYGVALYYGGMITGRMRNDPATKYRMIDAANVILSYETGNPVFARYGQKAESLLGEINRCLASASVEILDQILSQAKTHSDCMDIIHSPSFERKIRSLFKKWILCAWQKSRFRPANAGNLP